MEQNETRNDAARHNDAANDLANRIEQLVDDPEKAAKRIAKKSGLFGVFTGVFKIMADCVRSYNAKEPGLSDEEWMARQFAKPEYADAWQGKDAAAEQKKAAREIAQGVEDYENAKKSLRSHIKYQDGTEASWLARQIEIGAEQNGMNAEEYAREIQEGLNDAIIENQELLFEDGPEADTEEQK